MLLVIVFAFVLGIISGLRAMMAPAAVSWAARLGLLALNGTPLAFLGYHWTPYIITLLAVGEIVNDKLPATPSRKVPPQFIARVVSGSLVGAAVGAAANSLVLGLVSGAAGAVAGTLGGSAVRGKLAVAFGKDLPAALVEDAVAILVSVIIVMRF